MFINLLDDSTSESDEDVGVQAAIAASITEAFSALYLYTYKSTEVQTQCTCAEVK